MSFCRHSEGNEESNDFNNKSLSRDVRVSFFCVAKRKKPKKRLPRCRLFPSVLAPHLGGCGTRAFSTQTVLAAYHLPLKPKARQGD
jgi:hypothetical protein